MTIGNDVESINRLTEIIAGDSRENMFEWAVDFLDSRLDADTVKIAEATDDLLIPTVCTLGGNTGRDHAIPLAMTIPGLVYTTGEPCTISDLQDVRGGTTASHGSRTLQPEDPSVQPRSMVCAPIEEVGVILAVNREPDVFDDDDSRIVTAIGELVSQVTTGTTDDPRHHSENLILILDEIASIISHDIPNKVAVARGHLDLAAETGEKTHFETVNEALTGIQSITDMVATLARTGRAVDKFEEIDLREAGEAAFRQLDAEGAHVSVCASETILADPACLARILENLFRNAIDHSNAPVHITVGLLDDGFYVADDGPGVPEEFRDDVFTPGFTTGSDHDGSGLTIVEYLATAHGWDLSLTESATGGTRVEFHRVVFR